LQGIETAQLLAAVQAVLKMPRRSSSECPCSFP